MAYYNYQQYYPQVQPNFMPQQNIQPQNTGITWVQGENAAKSYPVAAGQSILLMDSESSVMYIKSTDQSGMPLPLRIFDYTERKNERVEHSQTVAKQKIEYISRDEFNAFRDEIRAELKQSNRTSTAVKKTAKEE